MTYLCLEEYFPKLLSWVSNLVCAPFRFLINPHRNREPQPECLCGNFKKPTGLEVKNISFTDNDVLGTFELAPPKASKL